MRIRSPRKGSQVEEVVVMGLCGVFYGTAGSTVYFLADSINYNVGRTRWKDVTLFGRWERMSPSNSSRIWKLSCDGAMWT